LYENGVLWIRASRKNVVLCPLERILIDEGNKTLRLELKERKGFVLKNESILKTLPQDDSLFVLAVLICLACVPLRIVLHTKNDELKRWGIRAI